MTVFIRTTMLRAPRSLLTGALFALLALLPASLLAQTPDLDTADMSPDMRSADASADLAAEDVITFAQDATITRRIAAIFSQIQGLRNVSYRVEAGLVTLTGEVEALQQRERAEVIAGKLDGVIAVQNLITVADAPPQQTTTELQATADRALKEKLTGIFANIEELSQVRVSVDAGIVKLSGQVAATEQRDTAEQLASKIDGVVYVVNLIEIPTEISERVRPAVSQLKEMAAKVVNALPLLLISLVIMMIAVLLSRWVRSWQWPYRKLDDRPLIREIVRQVVSTGVILAGLLLVFELLDITTLVGALLGTAGVAGLALGFAFQDIVENYLASLMLSARQPYKKGDVVQVGDNKGKIVRMTMRDTVLMTFEGNHVRIPNAQIFKSVLTNFTHNPNRRFEFNVGIGTEENLLDVQRIGIETLCGITGVLVEPKPSMAISELGDSSVICTFYGWIDQRQSDFIATRSEAMRRIKVRFEREGFDLPEPIYRLNLINRTPERALFPAEESALVPPVAAEPEKKAKSSEPLESEEFQEKVNEDVSLDKQIRQSDTRDKDDLL